MELVWVRAFHIVAAIFWAGALTALVRLQATRARAPGGADVSTVERDLYWLLGAPAMFIVFLTGIWMLHKQPHLLKQPFMHAKLTALALLMAADHLCLRGITRRPHAALRRVMGAAVPALVLCVVLLIKVRPWVK